MVLSFDFVGTFYYLPTDRRADQWIVVTDLFIQITQIRKMKQFCIVDMQEKGRWVYPNLSPVIDF